MASASVPYPETANDRLKRDAEAWLPRGIVAAVLVHFALFAFWPEMSIADINGEDTTDTHIVPPVLDMPKPPERIERPALPIVGSPDIDDAVTIPRFPAWKPDELTLPEARRRQELHEAFERFVPTMVAPQLLNAAAVERALQQNYPVPLRDAGIGGRVDVNLWLDVDGSVVRAEVASSSGYAALDAAALKVVDVMRLTPAVSMGHPVRVIVTLPVVFTVRRD